MGGGGLWGLAVFAVVVPGFAFVNSEAFEDELGNLFWRFVVEFDKSGGVKESSALCKLEPGEHNLAPFLLAKLRINGHPLPASPELFIIVRAYDCDDKVGFVAVELWQIDTEVVAGELSLVIFVVEDFFLAELLRENGGDLGDEVSFSPAKEKAIRKRFISCPSL